MSDVPGQQALFDVDRLPAPSGITPPASKTFRRIEAKAKAKAPKAPSQPRDMSVEQNELVSLVRVLVAAATGELDAFETREALKRADRALARYA